MNLLEQFIKVLQAQNPAPSRATVKNYKADIAKFIRWFENTYQKSFTPQGVSPQILKAYEVFATHPATVSKTENAASIGQMTSGQGLALKSLQRHLSSLRKFFNFLKVAGHIASTPFEQEQNSQPQIEADKWHIKEFKDHLYVFNASDLTIKNYIMDVRHFLSWAEKVLGLENRYDIREQNIFPHLTSILVNEYKMRLHHQAGLSHVSINRKLSSLRRFINWAQQEGYIRHKQPLDVTNAMVSIKNETNMHDPLHDTEVLQPREVSVETTFENGINISKDNKMNQEMEINPLSQENSTQGDRVPNTPRYSKFPTIRLFQKAGRLLTSGLEAALIAPLAAVALKANLLKWQLTGAKVFIKQSVIPNLFRDPKYVSKEMLKQVQHDMLGVLGIKNYKKELYAPLSISLASLPLHKKTWHHMRHTRPNWYKRYHENAIVHYFHFAILIIIMTSLGVGMYQAFINDPAMKKASAAPTAPPRILSFQGRLTDVSDNPITTAATPLRFAIYNDATATGSALLWEEIDSVSPDSDGIFSILLGNNTTIPQNLFGDNQALWLAITVQQTPELTPRQQIATVPYATNSELLQGMPPITQVAAGTTNVILALDSSGNLTIGGTATPVFQATGGSFTLSGNVLNLTTNAGSNGNIVLSPDGSGLIDLQKPVFNSTISNNISSAKGAVEVDDLFAVLATSSGQSAVTINQNGIGPIISASSSGVARFTVDNGGNTYIGGTLTSSGVGTNSFVGSLGIGTTTPLEKLDVAGNATISGNLTLYGAPRTIQTTDNNRLTIGSNTTGQIIFNPSGNIGIATTNPGTTLDINGSFRASGAITFSTFTNNGGILYTNGSGNVAQTTAGTAAQCLLGGTTPSFGSCGGGYWDQLNGALYTSNTTVDLFVGGTATASAKFAVLNVNGGTPVASVSSGVGGNGAYYTADGTFATTNRQTLTIGNSSTYNTTGDVLINPNGTGNVGIGTTAPKAKLDVRGSATISATLSLGPMLQVDAGACNASSAGKIYYDAAFSSYYYCNGSVWTQVGSGGASYWDQQNGSLYPINSTVDFFVGGQATTSAKFAVLNLNPGSGIPVASVSSGLNGVSAYLTADGILGTTNNQSLTLGSLTTGNIDIGTDATDRILTLGNTTGASAVRVNTGSGNFAVNTNQLFVQQSDGNVGIGITSPGFLLEVNGTARIDGNTTIGDASGDTLTVNADILSLVNASTLDLVDTQTSALNIEGGLLNFDTTNSRIGIGTTVPTATLDVAGAASIAGMLSFRDGPASIVATQMNDLTIGDSATGKVIINPAGNVGIGLTNPTFNFEVAGTVRLDGDTTIGDSSGDSLTVNAATLSLVNASTLDLVDTQTSALNIEGGLLNFDTTNSRIGIGTTDPTATLDVAGAASVAGSLTFRGGAASIVATENSDLTLGDNNTSNLILNPAGNIGIATLAPTSFKLQVAGSVGPNATNTYDLGSTVLQWNNIYGQNLYSNGELLANSWVVANGAIYPKTASVLDLLIGGQSTTSAKFSVLNVNSGTPVASVSSGVNGTGMYITADGTLATTKRTTLTIGNSSTYDTTGNVLISPNGTGNVGIGLTTPLAKLDVAGTASIASSLTFKGGPASIVATQNSDLTLGDSNTSRLILNPAGNIGIGTLAPTSFKLQVAGSVGPNATNTYDLGSLALQWNNIYGNNIYSNGELLTNDWRVSNGSIYPKFASVLDLLIGGQSTASAKFAVLNVNSGTPVASVSSGVNGTGMYITADGTLATTKRQSLIIGNSATYDTTGDVLISPGTGYVGIGTTNPLAKLDVRFNGTAPVASFSGQSSNATLVVDNSGVGDIFTASSSGQTRLSIKRNGNIDIASLTAGGLVKALTPNGTLALATAGVDYEVPLTFSNGLTRTVNAVTLGGTLTGATDLVSNGNNLYLSGTGNIGIGNTAAGQRLQIGAYSGSNYALVTTGTTGGNKAGYRTQSNSAGGVYWDLMQDGNTDVLQIARSGSVLFTINSSGNLGIGQTNPAQKLDVTGNIVVTGTTNFNGDAYTWPTSGTQTNGYTLTTNGAGSLTWSDPADATSNYWTSTLGSLYPKNSTLDFFIGGKATASAKFAILNMVGAGVPTASVSGGVSGNAALLTANGFLATANQRTLTIGDANTGDLAFAPDGTTRMYIQTGGNVGIGTTAPLALLDVSGASILRDDVTIGNTGADTVTLNAGALSLINASTLDLVDTSVTALKIEGTLMNFDTQNARIGIGNTAPSTTLDVTGTLKVSSTTNFGNITYTWPGSQSGGYVLQTNGSGTLSWVDGSTLAEGTNYWIQTQGALYPKNSTVDFFIGGQATLSAKFAVLNMVGAGIPTASVSAGAAGATYLKANGILATTAFQPLTIGASNTGEINLSPNGISAVTVLLSRNVGIGTTIPLSKLDVNGGVAIGSYAGLSAAPASSLIVSGNIGIGITNPGFVLEVNGTGRINGDTTIGDSSGDALIINASTLSIVNASTLDLVNSQTSALNIESGLLNFDTNNARLGIGTTTPRSKLEIAASGGTYGTSPIDLLRISNTDTTATDKAATMGFYANRSGDISTSLASISAILTSNAATAYTGALAFSTAGTAATPTERMRIDSAGNVGIGTTLPLATLDVRGNLGTTPTASISANSSFAALVVDNRGSGNLFTASSSGLSRFVISQNGNVGIGTTTPNALLTVAGSGGVFNTTPKSLARFYNNDTTATNNAVQLTLAANRSGGIETPLASISAIMTDNGATTYTGALAFSVANTAAVPTEAMRIVGGGNVGIGTTTPIATLDIRGNLGTTPAASVSANSSFAALVVDNKGVGDIFTASSSGLARFVIKQNGNVGIGLNSPAATLDILGSLKVSGTTTFNTVAYTWPAADAVSAGYVLTSNGTGGLSWSSGPASVNYWSLTNGALYPNNSTVDLFIGGTSSSSAKFAFLNVNSGTPTFKIFNTAMTQTLSLSHDGTDANIVSSTGNINLGTAGGSLFVETDIKNDTLNQSGYIQISDKLLVQNGEGAGTALAVFNNTGLGDIFTASASGTTRFVITSAGNVGIGTSTPTLAQLQVGTPGGSGSIASSVYYDVDSTVYYLDPAATGTSLLTAGNVGIGTTTPLARLSVAGSGGIYNTTPKSLFTLSNTDATAASNAAAMTFYANRNGGISTAIASISAVLADNTGIGYNGDLIFSTARVANVPIERMRINGFGGVGIGYTNMDATAKLAVNGNVGIGTSAPNTLLNLVGSGGLYNTTPKSMFNIYNNDTTAASNAAQMTFFANRSGGISTAIASISAVLADNTGIGYNGDLIFSTARVANVPIERMRINGFGGVGIGYTNMDATAKLAVNGNVGIGTSAPNTLLNLVGSGGLYNTTPKSMFNIYNNDTTAASNAAQMTFFANRSGGISTAIASISAVLADNGATTYYGDLLFSTASMRNVPTERMRINGFGNVGIGGGETNGYFGTARFSAIVSDTSNWAGVFDNISAAGSPQGLMVATGQNSGQGSRLLVGLSQSKAITRTDFVINNDGNVGIGDSSPDSILDIETPAGASFIIDAATTDNTTTTGVIDLNVDTITSTNIGLNIDYKIKDASSNVTAYGERLNLTVDTDAGQNHTAYGLYINATNDDATSTMTALYSDAGTGAGTEYAGVFMNGNVGIGVTNPAAKLDIVGGGLRFGTTANTINFAADSVNQIFNVRISERSSGACSSGTQTEGLRFIDNGGTQRGHVCMSGSPDLHWYANEFAGSATDLAENYSDHANNLEPGDVVMFDKQNRKGVKKSQTSYDRDVIGIISTAPGFLLSDIDENGGKTELVNPRPVALSGRVPTKVSTENGPIEVGDYLTSSSTPGVAMKATSPGQTVGRALEKYTGGGTAKILAFVHTSYADPKNTLHFADVDLNGTTTIENLGIKDVNSLSLISQAQNLGLGNLSSIQNLQTNPTNSRLTDVANSLIAITGAQQNQITQTQSQLQNLYAAINQGSNSAQLATLTESINNLALSSTDFVAISPNATPSATRPFMAVDSFGKVYENAAAYSQAAIANLHVGVIDAQVIKVSGQTLKDYIVTIITEAIENGTIAVQGEALNSPIAQIDRVYTNALSPLPTGNGAIAIDGNLQVNGSATVSGKLTTNSLQTTDSATIGGTLTATRVEGQDGIFNGTLRARNIVADNIEGLQATIATMAAHTITNITNVYQSTPSDSIYASEDATHSALLAALATLPNGQMATYSGSLDSISHVSAEFGQFNQGLIALGPSSFTDVSVASSFSVGGSMIFQDNAINTLGYDLQLQPLRQGGISIMAGLIHIDTNGNTIFGGDATFNKNITINGKIFGRVISPIPDEDLVIALGNDAMPTNSQFKIKNSSGSAVFAVNQAGDLIASGSATFNKLNLSLIKQAIATGAGDLISFGAAGVATISATRTEITIHNSMVTKDSLIYITPVGTPSGQATYLMRQKPGQSFTIGGAAGSIFNWLIVN